MKRNLVVALMLLGAASMPATAQIKLDMNKITCKDFLGYNSLFLLRLLNWKYLLLGFILFRLFDIWKPFPARQAESLPGGWGIMADDWIAGVYAALGLWLARAVGM